MTRSLQLASAKKEYEASLGYLILHTKKDKSKAIKRSLFTGLLVVYYKQKRGLVVIYV